MGSFANTLFMIMLGWFQTAASAIWSAFTNENGGSFLEWIGRNWILLAAVLCVTGMALDLAIYILRWRPILVWRSFFRRFRHGEEEPEETEQESSEPAQTGRLFLKREETSELDDDRQPLTAAPEQEDLSRWTNEEPDAAAEAKTTPKKPTITGAGYTVPADSPYRRPTVPVKNAEPAEQLQLTEKQKAEEPEDKPEIMTQRKRRRRLIVGDLFTDPEEELYPFETPQQLIDKNKAYHKPVYPRNWKKDEGEEE